MLSLAFVVYFLILSGGFLFIQAWTAFASVPLLLGSALVLAAGGVAFLWAGDRVVRRLVNMTVSGRRPVPLLSKARAKLMQELWDEARRELAVQWVAFPGHPEVLREYERLFLEGLQAPAAMVSFFKESLAQVKSRDRAYVYLRIAELLSGKELCDPAQARSWCRRLAAEFPDSDEGKMACRMLETLPKGP